MINPSKMREVFINLIKNAVESLPPKGTVKISLTASSQRAIVQIADNGCGMSTEQLLHAFDPFISYRKDGVGLGLFVVRRILDAHGGSISISSLPGSGTTVTVSLPLIQKI